MAFVRDRWRNAWTYALDWTFARAIRVATRSAPPILTSEPLAEDDFGRLRSIVDDDLIALGSRIRQQVLHVNTTEGSVDGGHEGSFNLVAIVRLDDTKMAIRVPAVGKHGDLRGPAEAWMKSHVRTLQFIRDNTTIPVPEVLHFDTTANNEIRAPYIALSFISGGVVSDLWFDDTGPTPLEQRRRTILKQLAEAMVQLNLHRFEKIGSLLPNDQDDGFHLDTCFGWSRDEDGTLCIETTGPHSTASGFIRSYWAPPEVKSHLTDGTTKFSKTLLSCVPKGESGFALAPADLDFQNIMADEQGNITGIVDWDNAQTMPGVIGCLKYPVWIVRDLDPVKYGQSRHGKDKNTVEELREFRAYYLEQMRAALAAQGRGGDYTLTQKSDVFEAFWNAYSLAQSRTQTCQRFVEEAKDKLNAGGTPIPDGLRSDSLSIIRAIGSGQLGNECLAALTKGLKAVMSLEE